MGSSVLYKRRSFCEPRSLDGYAVWTPIFAAMRVDELFAAGDLDGNAVWMGVIRAIKELTNTDTPESEEPLN